MIQIPSTVDIYEDLIASIEAKYSTTLPESGKLFLRTYAQVMAAELKLFYIAVGNVQKNIFCDTADPASMGGTLERFGQVKIQRNPFPATAGVYTAQVTGETGAVIPANTIFKSDDDSLNPGFLFALDEEYTLDGTNIITVRALTVGLDAQLAVGNTLTETAPIPLVESGITILTETTEPLAAEEIEEYREKVIDAYRLEPQGGAGADYRLWAADVQGVEQSYPFASSGNNNEVDLFIEATIADSTDGKGTPPAAMIDEVRESIEDPTVDRPSRYPLAVFDINYYAVTPKNVTINIADFVGITAEIQAAILAALTLKLSTIRPYVGSIDPLTEKNDILDINNIIATILEANPGSTFGSVTMTVASLTYLAYTFQYGEIPYLLSVTYS